METTLIILKPDAVNRGICGRILTRFEDKGLQIVGCKLIHVDADLAGQHYAEHKEKPFFPELVEFITATPVFVLALRGVNAVTVVRGMLGKTKGYESAPGTIRGDFSSSGSFNLVHGSDSLESAAREIDLYFTKNEIHDYTRAITPWLSMDSE